jgi:hypothetical protein
MTTRMDMVAREEALFEARPPGKVGAVEARLRHAIKRGKARAYGSIAQSLITKARAGDTACMSFFSQDPGLVARDDEDRAYR